MTIMETTSLVVPNLSVLITASALISFRCRVAESAASGLEIVLKLRPETPRTCWLCTSERKPSCSISKHGKARETTCRQAWLKRTVLPDHRQALDKHEKAHHQLGEPGGSPPA